VARHKRDYGGEQFTAYIHFKCTPGLRREVIAAARRQAVTISDFTREIVSAHLTATPIAFASRRDPEIAAKLRAMMSATHAVNGVRSLMNQIARHGNITQELGPYAADLREAIGACEGVAAALLTATEALIAA
jgi:hypothetical protein